MANALSIGISAMIDEKLKQNLASAEQCNKNNANNLKEIKNNYVSVGLIYMLKGNDKALRYFDIAINLKEYEVCYF